MFVLKVGSRRGFSFFRLQVYQVGNNDLIKQVSKRMSSTSHRTPRYDLGRSKTDPSENVYGQHYYGRHRLTWASLFLVESWSVCQAHMDLAGYNKLLWLLYEQCLSITLLGQHLLPRLFRRLFNSPTVGITTVFHG